MDSALLMDWPRATLHRLTLVPEAHRVIHHPGGRARVERPVANVP
jgi:hypothetical protein